MPQCAAPDSEHDARILADRVLDAALCGYEYNGLPKLLNVIADFRLPRCPVTVVRETMATAMLDGGNNTGRSRPTAPLRQRSAVRTPMALLSFAVCLGNTWMTGRSAYYCEMIARGGLVVIHTVAAPFGGVRPARGTNDIAFEFPIASDPLVIDMGTSAFMATDLQFRAHLGTTIPVGPALGRDGLPTTDAAAARQGTLLPSAGRWAVISVSALPWPWTPSVP